MMAVKALIWSHRNDQPAYEVCADCPFGRYAISPAGEHGYGWKQPRQNVWAGFVPTCEEAKAAAQADYEARILSALTNTSGDPVAWWWTGPKGGFLADNKKPSWPCEPLYARPQSVAVRDEIHAAAKAVVKARHDPYANLSGAIKALEDALHSTQEG